MSVARGDFQASRLSESHRAQPTSENEAISFSEVMALREPDELVFFMNS